jgi:hypothetical protein
LSANPTKTDDRWSQLSRGELIALGKTIVIERLEALGCTVTPPSSLTAGKIEVRTPSGRDMEVFVSTQRVGGYVFWTKRRFQPASDRFAAIALLGEGKHPDLYLVPSTDWLTEPAPFTNRDNIGKKSEPEFGLSLARSSLPALERYIWKDASAKKYFH